MTHCNGCVKNYAWNPTKKGHCEKCPSHCTNGCDYFILYYKLNFTEIAHDPRKIRQIINHRNFNTKYMVKICRCKNGEYFNFESRKCQSCPRGCSSCKKSYNRVKILFLKRNNKKN